MLDVVDTGAFTQGRIDALQGKCAWLTREAAAEATAKAVEEARAVAETKVQQIQSEIEETEAAAERRVKEVEERAAARTEESWP